jgi:hypothetical protein
VTRRQRQPGIAETEEETTMKAKYEQPSSITTAKGAAIDALLEDRDAMVMWFPSRKKAGCYVTKGRWGEGPDFYPTFLYSQAQDFDRLFYPFANGTVACIGSKRELDHWVAEAEKRREQEAA